MSKKNKMGAEDLFTVLHRFCKYVSENSFWQNFQRKYVSSSSRSKLYLRQEFYFDTTMFIVYWGSLQETCDLLFQVHQSCPLLIFSVFHFFLSFWRFFFSLVSAWLFVKCRFCACCVSVAMVKCVFFLLLLNEFS